MELYPVVHTFCESGDFNEIVSIFNTLAFSQRLPLINAILNGEHSCFEAATENDHLEIIEYLFNQLLISSYPNGMCPNLIKEMIKSLDLAVEAKKWKIINYFLITKPIIVDKWASFHKINVLCRDDRVDILKSLIEHEFDISNKFSENKLEEPSHCIFIEVCKSGSFNALKLFLENRDKLKFIDLHTKCGEYITSAFDYIMERYSLEMVKLMIELGAMDSSPFKNKLLVFMNAGLDDSILDYLMKLDIFSEYDKVEALELLGAMRFTEYQDADGYWEKAFIKREELGFPKENLVPQLEIFEFETEICSIDELKKSDERTIFINSLLVQERIMGPMAPSTISFLMDKGMFRSLDNEMDLAFMYWCHLLNGLAKHKSIYYDSTYYFYLALFEALETIDDLYLKSCSEKCYLSDILKYTLETTKLIYEHAEHLIKNENKKLSTKGLNLMVIFLGIVSKIIYDERYSVDFHDSQNVSKLKEIIKNLIRLKPKDLNNRELVISAFQMPTYKESSFFIQLLNEEAPYDESYFLRLADLFIDCRIDPNRYDETGESLLNNIIRSNIYKTFKDIFFIDNPENNNDVLRRLNENIGFLENNKLIKKFIDYGIHLDAVARDPYKLCAYDYIKSFGLKCEIIKPQLSLQCLCAKIINKNKNIVYKRFLPSFLCEFVDLH